MLMRTNWSVIAAVTIHIDAVACDMLFDSITMKFVEITPPWIKGVPLLMTAWRQGSKKKREGAPEIDWSVDIFWFW
jgi:hypothetical protein